MSLWCALFGHDTQSGFELTHKDSHLVYQVAICRDCRRLVAVTGRGSSDQQT